jgi:hypothetical protein
MADLIYSNLRGGAVRGVSYSSDCGFDCDACNATLPQMPQKVNTHEHPWAQPNWIAFAPRLNSRDKDCVVVDEIGTGTVKQVPAGYTMHRLWVPPYSILRSIGIDHKKYADDYGVTDTSFDGMIYDLVANVVDGTTCPPTIGAAVAGAIPAAGFTGIVAATAGRIIGSVAPASGGYITGANGVLLSFVVSVPPTTGLSNVKGEITIQANIESFNALIR